MELKSFRISKEEKVRLGRYPTLTKPLYASDKDYVAKLERFQAKLQRYQEDLFREGRQALLIVFQGMDTAGKDGAIKHVMSGVNPQGCQVTSFKAPSENELKHDFLWRVVLHGPERGNIGIFNRSYYEDVLVPRVHNEVLEKTPMPIQERKSKTLWDDRCSDIANHESYLTRQGYRIIKIFLHISKAEQTKRLLDRFDDKSKLWKLSMSDVRERACWGDYMKAYEFCFSRTSTEEAPWHIVPADDKKNARLIISQLIVSEFDKMKFEEPATELIGKSQLKKLKKELRRTR